jgi:hypothetical protein
MRVWRSEACAYLAMNDGDNTDGGTPVKSLLWGTAAQAHAFYCVDEDSMRENDLLERRKVAFKLRRRKSSGWLSNLASLRARFVACC